MSAEPEETGERYGKSLFGTSLLIARRLVEAGVTFVGVTTESRGAGHWDSHEKNFSMLKTFNLPNLDEISSALIEDLNHRGLLETTLVVIMGEMGRSPRVNGKAGRDHWPKCGFALLFGAGVKEGFVLGASDKIGGLSDRTAGLTRRPGRDDVPPPWRRFPDDASRPYRPAHPHRSWRHACGGNFCVIPIRGCRVRPPITSPEQLNSLDSNNS